MAKKSKTFTPHERILKRTSIGNPKKTKLKLSSLKISGITKKAKPAREKIDKERAKKVEDKKFTSPE